MSFEQWIPTQLTAERGIKTIQLSAEGAPWETWGAPWPSDAQEVVGWAKAVIAANAAESRKGRVNLLFTAIGEDGAVRASMASFCMGTNSAVDALVGSGGGSAKAFSDAMQGQAALMNTLLTSAKLFVEQVTKANESLTAQLVDLQEYKHAMQTAEIAVKADESGMSDFIMQQVKENSPLVMEALGLLLEGVKKSGAAAAPKAVAAVTQINGVKS